MNKHRCSWPKTELDIAYHDNEWGMIKFDDRELFEALILETMQSGLSWSIVLKKRDSMREVFNNFNFAVCSEYSDDYLDMLLENTDIIRHKLKIYAVRSNARSTIEIIKEYSSLHNYIWKFSNYEQISDDYLKKDIAERISRDMKKRGFKFVGPTTIYSFLEAVGVINSHVDSCFKYRECNIRKEK